MIKSGSAKARDRLTFKKSLPGYLFIMPWLIGFIWFLLGPLLFSFYSSFTLYNITSIQKWRGLKNYIQIFTTDTMFPTAMSNTLYYVVFSVPLVIIFALVLALLLNNDIKGIGVFRTIYYIPSVLSGVAVTLLWWWIFNPSGGLINNFLLILGIRGPGWFEDPNFAKPALIIMRLWHVGGSMVLFLAALKGVPRTFYEAAEIDGASSVRKFFNITIPLISPTILFVTITQVIGAFQIFDSAFIISKGDGRPQYSTMFYVLYLYRKAFVEIQMGYACALAWVLFIIIMMITLVQLWISKKWVHYEGGE